MKKYNIEEKEIFSLLTSKQISEISDAAIHKDFDEGKIVYDQKEQVKNLYILIEGEVTLRIPSREDNSIEKFSLNIEKITGHGSVFGTNLLFGIKRSVFGTNLLFGIKRYMTRARVTKPSKILVIDAETFLSIIRENHAEFPIMAYLAKVYFKRYIYAMKEFEECSRQIR